MNKFILPSFFLLALISVLILSNSISYQSRQFFAIASQSEQAVSFQFPVEIIDIIENEKVTEGEVILEVKQHEMDNNIATLDQEIKRITLQKQETNDSISNKIESLEAKKQAVTTDIDYQIHILELREKINSTESKKTDPNIELNFLKKKRHFLKQSIQAEINHLTVQLSSTIRPIDTQLNELIKRKEVLQQQNINFKVYAKFDGYISSINYKIGELVPPHQPILRLRSPIPRYAKGYVHENIINDVRIGQPVTVRPLASSHGERIITGIVESMGEQIVEYPNRFKKSPHFPVWGREIVIRLDDNNHNLIFGEKVEILLQNEVQPFTQSLPDRNPNKTIDREINFHQPFSITSSNTEIDAAKIEASGILWLRNDKNYLLISDERHNGNLGVFAMSAKEILTEQILLPTVDKDLIDDIESISTDNEYIYLLSSLSHNKKLKLKKKRRKLLRFKYNGNNVTEYQEIDLYEKLKIISNKHKGNKVYDLLNHAIEDKSLDIESHFIESNNLYLGLKSPFTKKNKTIILKVKDISALFEDKEFEAEIWKTIPLIDSDSGKPMKLTDMTLVNDQLFLLSVMSKPNKKSILWQYQIKNESLKQIEKFPFTRAEGITYRPDNSSFTVVFDKGGNSHSKYLSIDFKVY